MVFVYIWCRRYKNVDEWDDSIRQNDNGQNNGQNKVNSLSPSSAASPTVK